MLNEGQRLVVRLGTPEETAQALVILQQASQRDMTWITRASSGADKQEHPILDVDAPASHSQEIIALLARHNLFVAEIYQTGTSLEDFFLKLTGSESGEGSRAHRGSGAPGQSTPDRLRAWLGDSINSATRK